MAYPYFTKEQKEPRFKYKILFISTISLIFSLFFFLTANPKITGLTIINNYSNVVSENIFPNIITIFILCISVLFILKKINQP